MKSWGLFIIMYSFAISAFAVSNGYYRFPTIHEDVIVFTAEGDLWRVSSNGGNAGRLTTHLGEEKYPAISPDGKWIAFTGNYDGPCEVYVIPINGGIPKRLTFLNVFESNKELNFATPVVLGWTKSGDVLYSAQFDKGPNLMKIVAAIDPATLSNRIFPLADANDAAFDETGEYLYFTRFGLISYGDNARYYHGGAKSQLWRYKLNGVEAEPVGGKDDGWRHPLWYKESLIVIGNKDGNDNLWRIKSDGSNPQQLTKHAEFGVKGANLSGDRVIYQLGADLRVLDLTTGTDEILDIHIQSDFAQKQTRWIKKPLTYLSSSHISPNGKYGVLNARGRVYLTGIENRRSFELNQSTSSRIHDAVMSHDGKWIYAISDISGEEEVWKFSLDSNENNKQLTHDGKFHRWSVAPSPDGNSLAHADSQGRLWLMDIKSGKNSLIDNASESVGENEYDKIVWSPNSDAIVFVRPGTKRLVNQIALYSIINKQITWLTSDKYKSYSPSFSSDGKWLWFLSERNFDSPKTVSWGDRNVGAIYDRRTKIFAIALQSNSRFKFFENDELHADDKNDKSEQAVKSDGKSKNEQIELNGISERLYEVPVESGNYSALQSDDKRLYVLDEELKDKEGKLYFIKTLKSLEIGNTKSSLKTLENDIKNYEVSSIGKTIFYNKNDDFDNVYAMNSDEKNNSDASGKKSDDSKGKIKIDWQLKIDPNQEWREIFNDAWRLHRDHFYDSNMRGVDWLAKKNLYAPLLDRVTDRIELNDILAQMMGELGALHSRVKPGDIRQASEDTPKFGGLGAQLESTANGLKILNIYASDPELPKERGPLLAANPYVRAGDVITAIDGIKTANRPDFSELLRGKAGKQVKLDMQRGNKTLESIIVKPINRGGEDALRYRDWEINNKKHVEKIGNGKLGYIHLREMRAEDMAEFVKEFYAQFEREGLIIDVRRNRGGNIDSLLLEKLLRRVWAFWAPPFEGESNTNMQQTFRGKMLIITDALTYSDGEAFAAGFKSLGLGDVIGNQTAGAGVWLDDDYNKLIDDGRARAAQKPVFDLDGNWIIEGIGVMPDFPVDNLPHKTFLGEDQQLDKAIALLNERLQMQPVKPLIPGNIPSLPDTAKPK